MCQNTFLTIAICSVLISKVISQSFTLKIQENVLENTLISDLSSFDNSPDLQKNKQFSLISDKKANILFRLLTNGTLLVAQNIDRERLCSQVEECCHVKKPCILSLLVAIMSTSMVSSNTIEVQIEIEDENDNSPKFKQTNLTIFIKESDPVGSIFQLSIADDLDSEKFSIKHYKLIEDRLSSQMFSLEESRAGTAPNLQLIHGLDREKKSDYELTLLAIDGGNPPRSGKLLITIKVVDVNDNSPRLLRNNYQISIPEDLFKTDPLLTIEATDDDEGENAEMHFKIVDENQFQGDANKYFRIEQGSGKIFLNEKLDYEKQESFRFFVEVSNRNSNIKSATATVVINVENKNDEIPEISVNYLNGGKSRAIIEENNPGVKFVALATVTDKDKGIGGQVSCRLMNYFDTFEILSKDQSRVPNQYDIKTKVSLDREKVASYKVTMECEDRGYPVQRSRKDIHVTVEDRNDNSPKIITGKSLTVKENLPKDSLVAKIEAKDDDDGKNGQMTFSIDRPEELTERLLTIDSVTGELRTREKIDREHDFNIIKELYVPIKVYDHGDPSRSEIKTFTVVIIDENDNPPKFAKDLTTFSVPENQPSRYTVGEISVTDKDDQSKIQLRLQLTTSHYSNPFLLFEKENRFFLNTTRTLDFEKEKSFELKVIATDGSHVKSHTVTTSILVTVTDENDNDPIIKFPTMRNFTVPKLSWRKKRGFIVLTVIASDKDDSDNGRLRFELSDKKEIFSIDPSDGTIRIDGVMTLQHVGQYDVKVVVRDHGSPAREACIDLTIEIDNSKQLPYSESEDHGTYSQNNYFYTKEGFLVISLVILLFFLMVCVFLILYMRHIRGIFPALPDIFSSCRRISKHRKCNSRSNSFGKSLSDLPFDPNELKTPLSFQQTMRDGQEKVVPPFYLNQYDPSGTSVPFPVDQHLSVNPYRQYESLNYQHYPGPNIAPYSYDKLFYSPSMSESTMRVSSPKQSTNDRHQLIIDPIHGNIQTGRRIINNIDRSSPLIQNSVTDRFIAYNNDLKCDEPEKLQAASMSPGSPDWRGHGRAGEKIDTYAITFPLEQSTFV